MDRRLLQTKHIFRRKQLLVYNAKLKTIQTTMRHSVYIKDIGKVSVQGTTNYPKCFVVYSKHYRMLCNHGVRYVLWNCPLLEEYRGHVLATVRGKEKRNRATKDGIEWNL